MFLIRKSHWRHVLCFVRVCPFILFFIGVLFLQRPFFRHPFLNVNRFTIASNRLHSSIKTHRTRMVKAVVKRQQMKKPLRCSMQSHRNKQFSIYCLPPPKRTIALNRHSQSIRMIQCSFLRYTDWNHSFRWNSTRMSHKILFNLVIYFVACQSLFFRI